jgi:undecaprenyl phosphate-alpha-L-ara4N flippase subunit ArnF
MNGKAHPIVYWCLIGASILLSAVGQLCMKAGMHALAETAATTWLSGLLEGSALFWTLTGLLSYGVSMLAWLAVLTRYPLSLGYPLLSLSYVLVYVGATHWPALMETATPTRTGGTLLIAAGVAIVSLTGRRQS